MSKRTQYCHVGNTAQYCRLGSFQDSDFPGDLEDSKSISRGILRIFGSRTFVPTCWMCKNQTSVSHSSAESEIISLEAGLRMDGLPGLDLWDVVIEVLHSTNNTKRPIRRAPGNWCETGNRSSNKTRTKTPIERSNRDVDKTVKCGSRTLKHTHSSQGVSQLYILKTTKQSSRWLSKDEVQQWDTCPEPTELRLTGCSTESN